MGGRRPVTRPIARGRSGVRAALAGTTAVLALSLLATPTLADENSPPLNAVSSTGGVATAEGVSNVSTGDIITGLNTGHSVDTGGTANGDLIVTVAEMSSAADLAVIAEVGSQIADASGGDEGDATTSTSTSSGPQPPTFNVNIDTTTVDRSRTDNRSSARGIGEGGEGGEGGAGGNVIIGGDEPDE